MSEDDRPITVYHDGACPLCRAEIAHYRGLDKDGKIIFVDVSDPAADPGLGLDRTDALAAMHVRTSDGEVVRGAKAFRGIWGALPGWRWLSRLAHVPGVTALGDLVYRLFLPVRPLVVRAFVALSRLAGREP